MAQHHDLLTPSCVPGPVKLLLLGGGAALAERLAKLQSLVGQRVYADDLPRMRRR